MAIPDFQSLMLPLLEELQPGEATAAHINDRLADRFDLTQADREQLLPSGRARTFLNRVGWASTHLRKAGLIENRGIGRYHLTPRGTTVLASHPPKVDMKLLDQFDGYKEWRGGGGAAPTSAPVKAPEAPGTPEEILEATHRQLQARLEQDLLDRVRAVSPAFFEQLVVT